MKSVNFLNIFHLPSHIRIYFQFFPWLAFSYGRLNYSFALSSHSIIYILKFFIHTAFSFFLSDLRKQFRSWRNSRRTQACCVFLSDFIIFFFLAISRLFAVSRSLLPPLSPPPPAPPRPGLFDELSHFYEKCRDEMKTTSLRSETFSSVITHQLQAVINHRAYPGRSCCFSNVNNGNFSFGSERPVTFCAPGVFVVLRS